MRKETTPVFEVEDEPFKCTIDRKSGKRLHIGKLAKMLEVTPQHLYFFLTGQRDSKTIEAKLKKMHPEALRSPYCTRKKKK